MLIKYSFLANFFLCQQILKNTKNYIYIRFFHRNKQKQTLHIQVLSTDEGNIERGRDQPAIYYRDRKGKGTKKEVILATGALISIQENYVEDGKQ